MASASSGFVNSGQEGKDVRRDHLSWVFDNSKPAPKQTKSLQDSYNYQIPYPEPLEQEEAVPFMCSRLFLVIVNLIFFIMGFILVIMAIIAAGKPSACASCFAILRPLLISGMIMTLVSCFGFFGAVFNSYKMLLLYVTCATFLLLLQLIVFFWSLFGQKNFKRRTHAYLTSKMRSQPSDLVPLLELVQKRYDCCGVDGPMDYHMAGLQIPRSCCRPGKGVDCSANVLMTTPPVTTNASTELSNTTESMNTTVIVTTTPKAVQASRSRAKIKPKYKKSKTLAHRPKKSAHRPKRGIPPGAEDEGGASTTEHVNVTRSAPPLSTESPANSTGNATDAVPAALLVANSSIAGGPEHWNLHHVKMRGCYVTIWNHWARSHALLVAAAIGVVLFLSMQLTLLCLAHGVARGGFIEQR